MPARPVPATSPVGRASARGQAIVVMVGVILVSIAMLAVIIDGGNVMTQQRVTQTGSDSTAEAGAVVLASRLAGAAEPLAGWDATIQAKLAASAAVNNMTVKIAYYTDICGIPLKADGTAALNVDGSEDLASALTVGNVSNSLPGGTATTPDCPSRTVGPVAGVMVVGEKVVGAYVARAIGMPSFDVTTRATAVAGYLQGYCAADQGEWCAVLPVTIPVNQVTCDGSNEVVPGTKPWPWNTVLTVPLCKGNAGNVGWLDWTPPGGGAQELVCSIINPDNPLITLPSWQWVPETGNTNGGGKCVDDDTAASYTGVEDAIRKYNGQIVLIPQFDLTCRVKNGDPDPVSTKPTIETGPNFGCPNAPGGGTGQTLWYRMPSFAFFQLCDPGLAECSGRDGAYIQGNDSSVCDTGNGATSCLVGKFTDVMGSGTVGPGNGSGTGSKAIGVQLIR
ncbi:MAG TPA: hypothetical protein VFI15_04065 [Candidatus Limnocylindrales bacterium]|nr:hypothetical protein [Candidatus Limnocylindrales bacterium]